MSKSIELSQGAGGEHMDRLIKHHILTQFGSIKSSKGVEVPLSSLDDAAVVDDIVFSTDSHTVKPLEFPGGDIGSLAVAGTVNDVAVLGAEPRALSAGFLIEEGLPFDLFDRIISSMTATAQFAGVPIVTGDTKVVEHGALQQFMINTSGIGRRNAILDNNFKQVTRYRKHHYRWLLDRNVRDGDVLILSGSIGEHGIALLSYREGYGFETKISSDIAPINRLLKQALSKAGGIVAAKDPTRGGLANTVNEFCEKSGIGIILDEEKIPILHGVQAACDLLGYDPLEIGNEGKVVLAVIPEKADDVLQVLRKHPQGKKASIIGHATSQVRGVVLKTEVGGQRIVHKPLGDPIPRIC
ncbi:MAG: hydrogenase expression/formation protein HypE [Candidatus Thermoplasmatota archaeon]|nr:hydrogenase expression/formation protein HypE [Candidatus Thermoplasmatota archaeon]MBU1941014.1 hydrogenase expression/formation protein HypE [Candidatus Thermoplasmatota archaeon]